MIKNNILLLIVFFCIKTSYTQSTFKYLFKSPHHQTIGDIIETSDGCIIFPLLNQSPSETKIIKMNTNGIIVDSLIINNVPNALAKLLKYDNNSFFIAGSKEYQVNDTFWLCRYDFEFNLLKELAVPAYGQVYWNYIPLYINDKNNLVTNFLSYISIFDAQTCIMEINPECEIVRSKIYNNTNFASMTSTIIQKNKYYYFFVNGWLDNSDMMCNIYKLDTCFNNYGFINILEPYGGIWDLNSTRWINDSVFLLTGYYTPENYTLTKVIKIKADTTLLQPFKVLEIKDNDSSIRNAWYNNLDFIDVNNIYVGSWMYKTLPDYYEHVNTKIVLTKIDSALNIKWQRKYGGDGYYDIFGLKVTQDGGCVMGGTYYGPTQSNEKDPFIIKVDSTGFLSWIYNLPNDFIKLTVYPNPGTDKMIVNNPPINSKLVLYNINGQAIITQPLNESNSVNTVSLKSGIYLYQVINSKGKVVGTGKWVKTINN